VVDFTKAIAHPWRSEAWRQLWLDADSHAVGETSGQHRCSLALGNAAYHLRYKDVTLAQALEWLREYRPKVAAEKQALIDVVLADEAGKV
jgi:hypothetical protein